MPTYLPRTGATELVAAQGAPEPAVNEMGRYFDANASRAIIEDRDLATPPGTCADGACYLIAASPTGLWSGKAGKLAIAVGANAANGWLFQTVAVKGFRLYIKDENAEIQHNGTSWGASSSVSFATASEIRTGTEAAKAIAPDQLAASAAPQTLTDGATINWNMASGYNAKVTLGGNRTIATPTNPIAGMTYSLAVIQDATGSRTVTWPSAFDWGTTGAPTLTTTASKRDRITLFCTDAATPKFDAFLSGKGFG